MLAGIEGARFYRYARPGDRVILHARLVSADGDEVVMRGGAKVGPQRIARCELLLHRIDPAGAADVLDRGLQLALHRVLSPGLRERYADVFAGMEASS